MPTVIDNKTSNYAIPLPAVSNRLVDDIARLSSALFTIDLVLALKQDQSTAGAINGIATLDSSGRLTATQLPALSGDVTLNAGFTALTLSNTGVSAGTYNSVTVDTKGRVTAGTTAPTASLQPTTIITANYTANAYELVKVSTLNGEISITLPMSPDDGAMVSIVDVGNHFDYFSVTVYPGTNDTINYLLAKILSSAGMSITFVYIAANMNWQVHSASTSVSDTPSIIDGGGPISALNVQIIDGGIE
jgi:hypothetical protein